MTVEVKVRTKIGKLTASLPQGTTIEDNDEFKEAVIEAAKNGKFYKDATTDLKTKFDAVLASANATVDTTNSKVIFTDGKYTLEVIVSIPT